MNEKKGVILGDPGTPKLLGQRAVFIVLPSYLSRADEVAAPRDASARRQSSAQLRLPAQQRRGCRVTANGSPPPPDWRALIPLVNASRVEL